MKITAFLVQVDFETSSSRIFASNISEPINFISKARTKKPRNIELSGIKPLKHEKKSAHKFSKFSHEKECSKMKTEYTIFFSFCLVAPMRCITLCVHSGRKVKK